MSMLPARAGQRSRCANVKPKSTRRASDARLARAAGQAVERLEGRTLFSVVTPAAASDAALPTVSIGDFYAAEGNSGTKTFSFPVTLSAPSNQTVTVLYATNDHEATAGSDYVPVAGVVSFEPGATKRTISVTVNGDMTLEPDEEFFVDLSSPTNATIAPGQGEADGLIRNDDTGPAGGFQFNEGNQRVSEAVGTRTLTVSRVGGTTGSVSVHYATGGGTADGGGVDYVDAAGDLTWADGDATPRTVPITIVDDQAVEQDETVQVTLSDPTNGAVILGYNPSVLTIADNDTATPTPTLSPTPSITISDVQVAEGNAGTAPATFNLTLSAASTQPVSVNYATVDGTAKSASGDFQAASGTVTFAAGETSKPVTVLVNGDTLVEPNELFAVHLSGPSGATLAKENGYGTITNDDVEAASPGTLSFNDGSFGVTENGGLKTITVKRTGGAAGAVTVQYATADGSATAGSDYTATSGTLSWADGDASPKTFTVPILDDSTVEPSETVALSLSAPTGGAALGAPAQATLTITDDDVAPPAPTISVTNAEVAEGNAGTTAATFTISLSAASSLPVSVTYNTVDGTATATGSDYQPAGSTVTFAPGETSKPVTVLVNGDTLVEANELFALHLSNPVNATLAKENGYGTILNDDVEQASPGALSFSDGSFGVAENAGVKTITVRRTGGTKGVVGVHYATGGGTATAGADYVATSGNLWWADGDATPKTFNVTILDDTKVEPSETVGLALTWPAGGSALGTPAAATLTITDNDSPTTPTPTPTPTATGRIVFQSNRDGNPEIYAMNPDGSGQTRLTVNAAEDVQPRLSRDGGKIVFVSNRDGNPEVYSMNADGTGVTRLTADAGYDAQPAWSPDGTRIAFVSNRGGAFDLYVMNADGTGVTAVTHTAATELNPTFSPSGERLAFSSTSDGGRFQIFTIALNGTGLTRLTDSLGNNDAPAYSPDGARIAFQSTRDGNSEIYLMNANGTGQTNLTRNAAASDARPTFSPEGTTIAFASARGGNTDVYTMNLAGALLRRLTTHAAADAAPSWGGPAIAPIVPPTLPPVSTLIAQLA